MADGAVTLLLEGNGVEGPDPVEARQLITIYSDLLALYRHRLAQVQLRWGQQATRGGDDAPPDVIQIRAQLEQFEMRLAFWQRRHLELIGLEGDDQRAIFYDGKCVYLSRREWQLFGLLVTNPNRRFTVDQLLRLGWHDQRLSADQVRGYVARLRRRLIEGGLPCSLANDPRRGYYLKFDEVLYEAAGDLGSLPMPKDWRKTWTG